MPSYLEIALRAVSPAQLVNSEPMADAPASAERMAKQTSSFSVVIAAKHQDQPKELAPCGSPECAGCYDVGDGKSIHPPKIGEEYRGWLERWKPKGTIQ